MLFFFFFIIFLAIDPLREITQTPEGFLTEAPAGLHPKNRDARGKGKDGWFGHHPGLWETEVCSSLPDTLPSSVMCVRTHS